MKKKYGQLNESIKMIDNQRSDVEKINLIGKCKKLALMKLLSAMKLLLTV